MDEMQISGNTDVAKARTARSAIGSSNQHILDFLKKCTAFQADAIRVMVQIANANSDAKSVNQSEVQLVHRFLNHGYYKEDGAEYSKLLAHRQARSELLIKSVSPFLVKDRLVAATIAVMKISNNNEAVQLALQNLPSRQAQQAPYAPQK